jgi:tight adherence protein C
VNFIGSWGALTALGDGRGWIAFALLFAAVFIATLAIGGLVRSTVYMRQRMAAAPSAPRNDSKARVSLRQGDGESIVGRLLKLLDGRVLPMGEADRSAIRKRLVVAGYAGETAVRAFFAARIGLAIALPALVLALAPRWIASLSGPSAFTVVFAAATAGLFLPYMWLNGRTEERQNAIRLGFPDALDMLLVCVEAGLGLDAAMQRVSGQMEKAHPILARELGQVNLELRAGKSREEALQALAQRTGVQDLGNFVTLLIQSDQLGASLSQTLRVQAAEMRSKRMTRAEETAQKLPVKLTIPLVLFILPAMFAVVLGPAIINVARNLLPQLTK